MGANSDFHEMTPTHIGGNIKNNRDVSPESAPTHLNITSRVDGQRMSVNILGLKENDLRPFKKISYIYGLTKNSISI